MKFKIIFFSLIVFSCSPTLNSLDSKKNYTAKGFAYIYNEMDTNEKIIKGKLNNEIMQISHQKLKIGALIKLTNPKNNKSLVIKNSKRARYPEFYKILITKPVADKLDISADLPVIDIIEVKKNKSFIAKKAKIFNEEKKIPSKAPVASVQISNISKNKFNKDKKNVDKIYIHIASFYSIDAARFLKKRITSEIANFEDKKLKIKKITNKETQVISGPYTSINLLKNDYIMLKSFGFEELDIFINE
tara:strand:+ start:1128 stop:1865 length:738 start_codon:yes stop_codon:yes gene_type:complete